MRTFPYGMALMSAFALSTTAIAQEAATPTVQAGSLLKSSDGKRIGRVERIVKAKDGTPVSASVIYDSRFVYIPISTVSASQDGFVTSLSRAEATKLK